MKLALFGSNRRARTCDGKTHLASFGVEPLKGQGRVVSWQQALDLRTVEIKFKNNPALAPKALQLLLERY
jgi:hypothetical protein